MVYLRTIFILVISSFFLAYPLYAQINKPKFDRSDPVNLNNTYQFARLTENEGISDDVINMIYQDKYGFMWFGTMNGLNRYDGYKFIIYKNDPNDEYSIGHNHINNCYEDKNGNLWFMTHGGGISKYDYANDKFVNYQHNPKNKNSICSNYCFKIYEDQQGFFWICTLQGLSKMIFYPEKDTVIFVNYINDPKNKFSLKHNHVRNVWAPNDSLLWIFTAGGLNIFDKISEKFHHSLNWDETWPDLILENFKRLFPVSLDDIYKVDSLILRKNNYIYEFNPKDGFFRSYNILADSLDIPIANTKIRFLFESKSGDLWIGTYNNGMYVYNNKQKQTYHLTHDPQNPFSLCNNDVRRIFEDKNGNIWIGHIGKGISKYNPNHSRFSYNQIQLNLESCSITKIISEKNKSDIVWIGTSQHGLLRYDLSTGTIKQFQGPISNIVNEIFQDPLDANLLWIGTFGIEPEGGGFYRFNKKDGTFKRFYFKKKALFEEEFYQIRTIMADSKGMYWIATAKGLFRFDPNLEKIHRYPTDPSKSESLNDLNLTSIIETNNNEKMILWIGSLYGGLIAIEPDYDKISIFKHSPGDSTSISSNWVKSLYQSENKKIWLSTDKGLDLFDPLKKTFKHLGLKDRRLISKIFGIYEDRNDNLWFNAENVLARYNYHSKQIDIFESKYDFPLNSFNPNSHHQASNGKLFFGGPLGFISFHPDSLKMNTNLPTIIFTDFKIYNKSIKPGKDSPLTTSIYGTEEIYLNYDQSVFSLVFTALEYTIPKKNKYAYKMEDIDPDWVYTDAKQQFATYTNLDAGTYTFRVKACNNDGIWNEEGASIKVIILPPWWRTTWAYTFYVAFFFSVMGILWYSEKKRHKRKLREKINQERQAAQLREAELQATASEVRREAEKQHMRSRIASDLHDEIGSNLSSIALTSHILENKLSGKPEYIKRLNDLENLALASADAIRDIVWFINPANDSFEKLINKMRHITAQMLTDIIYNFNVSDLKRVDGSINLDVRRNLFLIYKEILNNIIRHSAAKNVAINLTLDDGQFLLKVKDDGIGFDPQIQKGNGLHNFHMRARAMNGSVQVNSQLNSGTEINIKVKIP